MILFWLIISVLAYYIVSRLIRDTAFRTRTIMVCIVGLMAIVWIEANNENFTQRLFESAYKLIVFAQNGSIRAQNTLVTLILTKQVASTSVNLNNNNCPKRIEIYQYSDNVSPTKECVAGCMANPVATLKTQDGKQVIAYDWTGESCHNTEGESKK